jgi:D-glycero-alpha-D-manno-heptose 1-phosphate guanylyltransferase
MADINGEPFLELLMNYWAKQGISKFIICVGYMKDYIINYMLDKKNIEYKIVFSSEERPLGTGGALLLAREKVTEKRFLLMNGDTFIDINLHDMVEYHEKTKADWTIAVCEEQHQRRYGSIKVNENEQVVGYDQSFSKKSGFVNTGVHIIETKLLEYEKDTRGEKIDLEADILKSILDKNKRVMGYRTKHHFIDIGTPDDFKKFQLRMKK